MIFARFARACCLLACLLACCCLLLAKPGESTLDTKEGYKTKTGSTSSVTLTLTLTLTITLATNVRFGWLCSTREPAPRSLEKTRLLRWPQTALCLHRLVYAPPAVTASSAYALTITLSALGGTTVECCWAMTLGKSDSTTEGWKGGFQPEKFCFYAVDRGPRLPPDSNGRDCSKSPMHTSRFTSCAARKRRRIWENQ